MSQFVLDDQLDVREVLLPLQRWTTAQQLRDLRPRERILDDRIPEVLRTLKQPTFITIDQDFWNRRWCDPNYGIVYFALRDDQQEQLPGLLRTLLRRVEFRTRARRMGKVARISTTAIDYWEFQAADLRHLGWEGRRRRKP